MTTTSITFIDQTDITAEIARLQGIVDSHQGQPAWAAAVELAERRIASLQLAGQLPLTIVS